jgi:hypothetical protein
MLAADNGTAGMAGWPGLNLGGLCCVGEVDGASSGHFGDMVFAHRGHRRLPRSMFIPDMSFDGYNMARTAEARHKRHDVDW